MPDVLVSKHLADDIALHSSSTSSPAPRSHVSAAPVSTSITQMNTVTLVNFSENVSAAFTESTDFLCPRRTYDTQKIHAVYRSMMIFYSLDVT